jgi:hypothetical protein
VEAGRRRRRSEEDQDRMMLDTAIWGDIWRLGLSGEWGRLSGERGRLRT